jgi:hypothetical protein
MGAERKQPADSPFLFPVMWKSVFVLAFIVKIETPFAPAVHPKKKAGLS